MQLLRLRAPSLADCTACGCAPGDRHRVSGLRRPGLPVPGREPALEAEPGVGAPGVVLVEDRMAASRGRCARSSPKPATSRPLGRRCAAIRATDAASLPGATSGTTLPAHTTRSKRLARDVEFGEITRDPCALGHRATGLGEHRFIDIHADAVVAAATQFDRHATRPAARVQDPRAHGHERADQIGLAVQVGTRSGERGEAGRVLGPATLPPAGHADPRPSAAGRRTSSRKAIARG